MTQQRARDSRGDRRTQHLQITTTPVPAHKPAGHRLAVRLRKGPEGETTPDGTTDGRLLAGRHRSTDGEGAARKVRDPLAVILRRPRAGQNFGRDAPAEGLPDVRYRTPRRCSMASRCRAAKA